MANNDLSKGVIFDIGAENTTNNYVGRVWSNNMVAWDDDVMNTPLGNVTFSPGAINNWHVHPYGQILLITGGRGYYQEEGKDARELHAGDVVCIPPNVKHWHGAAPDSWFTHIYIMTNYKPERYETRSIWMEPVSDYGKLK